MEPIKEHVEKRKHPRHTASNEYTLILNGIQHQGVIGNISLGGVYLSTISPSITDDNLFQDCEIALNLPETKLSIPCSISFVAAEHSKLGHGIGIAFSTVDEKSLFVLTQHIENIKQST